MASRGGGVQGAGAGVGAVSPEVVSDVTKIGKKGHPCGTRCGTTCFLLLLFLLHVIGAALFISGFFLTRFELPRSSNCSDVPPMPGSDPPASQETGNSDTCWLPFAPKYKRAVVLIVDALRHDFVRHFDETSMSASQLEATKYWRNHLPVLHSLVQHQPKHARLYRFLADPPTVTMQRLKGLTSGSLPTFLDVADNFDSRVISEDNIVAQLTKLDKRLVFMGDDTWTALFPDSFHKAFAYPSFNVKDLHSVDDGVMEHLVPEMKDSSNDVIIGHFLGVDHVGHTHSPSHPAMMHKLRQLNDRLQTVVDALDNDTLLVIMGDHGMTYDGNHGGATYEEVSAALFMYTKSPSGLTYAPPRRDGSDACELQPHDRTCGGAVLPDSDTLSRVAQVDLVPSLSFLLGAPVPFANMGALLPDLLYGSESANATATDIVNTALELNAGQVHRYIREYSQAARSFPEDSLRRLEEAFEAAAGATAAPTERTRLLLNYLHDASSMCREVWTQFDLKAMAWGIVIVGAAVAILLVHATRLPLAAGAAQSPHDTMLHRLAFQRRRGGGSVPSWYPVQMSMRSSRRLPLGNMVWGGLASLLLLSVLLDATRLRQHMVTAASLLFGDDSAVSGAVSTALTAVEQVTSPVAALRAAVAALAYSVPVLSSIVAAVDVWLGFPAPGASFALGAAAGYALWWRSQSRFLKPHLQRTAAPPIVLQDGASSGSSTKTARSNNVRLVTKARRAFVAVWQAAMACLAKPQRVGVVARLRGWAPAVAVLAVSLRIAGLFSNSYIVAEGRVVGFLATTVLLLAAWGSGTLRACVFAVAAVLCGRIAGALDVFPSQPSDISILSTVLPLLVMPYLLQRLCAYLRQGGAAVTLSSTATYVAHAAMLIHWATEARAKTTTGGARELLPRIVYGLSLAGVAVQWLLKPPLLSDDKRSPSTADDGSGAPVSGDGLPIPSVWSWDRPLVYNEQTFVTGDSAMVKPGTGGVTLEGNRMMATSAADAARIEEHRRRNAWQAAGDWMHAYLRPLTLDETQAAVFARAAWVVMHLLAPVMMMTGPLVPATVSLFVLQLVCIGMMLQYDSTEEPNGPQDERRGARSWRGADVGPVEGLDEHMVLWVPLDTRRLAPASWLVLWSLLATLYFFATDHVCEFGFVHAGVGFIGFESFALWRTGAMVVYETFWPWVVLGMALPAALLMRRYLPAHAPPRVLLPPSLAKFKTVLLLRDVAAQTAREGPPYSVRLLRAACLFQVVQSALFLTTMLFVYGARRHLMVWAIFAPKLVFDFFIVNVTWLAVVVAWNFGVSIMSQR